MEKKIEEIVNKKIRKITFLMLVVGLIFGSVIGATAYAVTAKQIGYTPSDNTWDVNNVESALNSIKQEDKTQITNLQSAVSNKDLTIEQLTELVNNSLNYSTSEKKIGTWIDGKPIYQKTVVIDIAASDVTKNGNEYSVSKTVNLSNTSIDQIVNTAVMTKNKTSNYFMQIPTFIGKTLSDGTVNIANYIRCYIGNNSAATPNSITIAMQGADATWTDNMKYYVTIQYTKTTDSTSNS